MSLPENVKVALLLVVGEAGAPEPSVVSGATVSGTTRQVRSAGVWSTLPAGSVARTRSLCSPTARPLSCLGDVQAVNASLSSAHSNVENSWLDEKAIDALVLSVSGSGPESIVVSGGVLSGAPNVTTSCGGSEPFSRLWNCCSASWFSAESRIRKPWFEPES